MPNFVLLVFTIKCMPIRSFPAKPDKMILPDLMFVLTLVTSSVIL